MYSHKLRVWTMVCVAALLLLVLVAAPDLALRALGVVRQGSVQEALAAAPAATDVPPGEPLDSLTIGSPASEWTRAYSVRDLWALEVTGRQVAAGQAEYRLVFDEAGFNRFFQANLASWLRDTPYNNLWFDLREGGLVVYATVNVAPNGWEFPFGAAYQGVAGMYTEQGYRVYHVLPFGPADRAGVRVGDTITELGGTPVADIPDFGEWIRSHNPGEVITLTVQRGEQERVVEVELGRWEEGERWRYLGLVLAPDVTGARLVPLGLSVGEDLYSLPKSGPVADAVADAQRMLDSLFEHLIVVGPLRGQARVAEMHFTEDCLTVVMR